jgi:hypothetical protein
LQKVSRTIEEVLGKLSVWELRESVEDAVPVAAAVDLVRIEVSGGNYGK